MRNAYGNLIGRIAASHWYDVKDLPNLLPPAKNAPHPFPREWTIDPVKIACLLRTADAAHIDSSRAPTFRMALVQPQGISLPHWTAQNKIDQPILADDALKYTSGEFLPEETKAWWQCADLIRRADRELRRVDGLLQDHSAMRFKARRILGTDSLEVLANYIPTQGWKPVDVQPHTSNITSLIQMLGGAQLYGNEPWVPLRELIQNAADAIRLYRVLHNKAVKYGNIDIVLRKANGDTWLEVRDNGVGMNFYVLSRELLDFG